MFWLQSNMNATVHSINLRLKISRWQSALLVHWLKQNKIILISVSSGSQRQRK